MNDQKLIVKEVVISVDGEELDGVPLCEDTTNFADGAYEVLARYGSYVCCDVMAFLEYLLADGRIGGDIQVPNCPAVFRWRLQERKDENG